MFLSRVFPPLCGLLLFSLSPRLFLGEAMGAWAPRLLIGACVPTARPGRTGKLPAARGMEPLPLRVPPLTRAPVFGSDARSALIYRTTGVHLLPSHVRSACLGRRSLVNIIPSFSLAPWPPLPLLEYLSGCEVHVVIRGAWSPIGHIVCAHPQFGLRHCFSSILELGMRFQV